MVPESLTTWINLEIFKEQLIFKAAGTLTERLDEDLEYLDIKSYTTRVSRHIKACRQPPSVKDKVTFDQTELG